MNFNDQIYPHEAFALQNEEEELYHNIFLESAIYQNRPPLKSKLGKDNPSKASLMRGKQNEHLKQVHLNNKNIATNHSFNGFFNQNSQKIKKTTKQLTNKRTELIDISNQTYQINNQQNLNTSGKLSSFQSIGDSNKNIVINKESIHQEVKTFIKKYFPENYQSSNFQGQYFSIQDFVEILFEEFQSLIGKKNSFNLIEHFTDKIFLIFGDKIYFNELFQKTGENGLTGLIFQIVKAINEDKNEISQQKENKLPFKLNQIPKSKNILSSKNIISFNSQFQKNQNSRQIIKGSDSNMQNSNFNRSNISKISLDKFFGNSISKIQQSQSSKVQFNQESKVFFQDQTGLQEQNLQEVKTILQNYIDQMYSEAEQKLTKKYTQQARKITLKYKEAQKLLEKVNEKISNHYDSIQLEKEYEKKIKFMAQKETQLQNRIKKIEEENKLFKDEAEKHKLNCFKQDQELTKLKEKIEKYENAFFEKAMQKAPNQNTINPKNRIKQQVTANGSIYSQQETSFLQQKVSQIPRFELKVDTFTENRPIVVPLTPSNRPPSYSPQLSRQLSGILTPTRDQKMQERSVSPLKQRISFIKAPNGVPNLRVFNGNQQSTFSGGNNSRIIYSTLSGNQEIKTGGNQFEMGEKIQLRSLSPIGKLGDSNLNGLSPISGQSRLQINTALNTGYVQQRYGSSQQSYSPLKVQFCTSQVSGTSMQSR